MLVTGLLAIAPASAEVAQRGAVRVSVRASLRPDSLPRRGSSPVAVSLGGHITPVSEGALPQLEEISVALNADGALDPGVLPTCALGELSASTDAAALAACRPSLVGEGRFSADVRLPGESPFPSSGRLLAFNGRYRGAPAILAHIYGIEPFPTAYVLPFRIERETGTYGTVLNASLPQVTGPWGYVTDISLALGTPRSRNTGAARYLSAGCPAPKGFPGAEFPLAKTTFAFAGGVDLSLVLNRSCTAR